MIINPYYTIRQIDNKTFLLPYGQGITEYFHGMELNSTSLFMYETLLKVQDRDKLYEEVLSEYGISPDSDDAKSIAKDVRMFMSAMNSYGVIKDDIDYTTKPTMRLMMGGIRVDLIGSKETISPLFKKFETKSRKKSELVISIFTNLPTIRSIGNCIIRNDALNVYDCEDKYLLDCSFEGGNKLELEINKAGSQAAVYVKKLNPATLLDDIFMSIRPLLLYKASLMNRFVIHSCSILYNNKVWIFSGHSGMGKSTHTNMWHDIIGTPIINGDINMLGIDEGKAYVYGIPWCGTSEICSTETYELGGIILLAQCDNDRIEHLEHARASYAVSQRIISPVWTNEQFNKAVDFAESITALIPVCRLLCTKNPSAVDCAKAWIDKQ